MPAEIPTPSAHEIVTPFDSRLPANDISPPLPPAKDLPSAKTEIAVIDGQMQLATVEQIWRAAKLIRQSGLSPKSFTSDQQVVIAILRALELRIPIFQALEGMSIINSRIGIMGDLALALVQASGELKEKQIAYTGEGDELVCTLILQRKGRKAQSYSFGVAEAKAAGIYERSAVWKSYPKRMTYYRALGFGLRDEFPDILKGIKTTEELSDLPS